MKDLTEKTITTTPIFQGRIISVRVDEVMLPNGQTSTREIVKHPGAVAILPFTAEGKLILYYLSEVNLSLYSWKLAPIA